MYVEKIYNRLTVARWTEEGMKIYNIQGGQYISFYDNIK